MKAISELMLKQITKEQFLIENNIMEIDHEIKKGLKKAYKDCDANSLEEYIYLIFVFEIFDKSNVEVLNKLLISDWHYQHENIASLLQRISSVESLDYLYKAIKLHCQYLWEDENYAFQVRCVRAIYYIGKEKSFSYLEELCKHENRVIREMAKRQIRKLM